MKTITIYWCVVIALFVAIAYIGMVLTRALSVARQEDVAKNRILWLSLIECVLVVILVFLVYSAITFLPPRAETAGQMNTLRKRILKYYEDHKSLPASLNELPLLENADNSTKDEWGREIIYVADDSGLVTLRSLDKDNKEGGGAEDKDIIGIFAVGKRAEQLGPVESIWIEKPR